MLCATTESVLLGALQQLSEAELTRGYLMPLFDAMGFQDVEHYGGPGEHGKDIIMWEVNKLGRRTLTAVQVKKLQLNGNAADKAGLPGLIAQLNQAITEPIPHKDGQSHAASSVWFVTPYLLETRTLQSQAHGLKLMRERGVEIVDGRDILKLLDEHRSDLLSRLGGHQYATRRSIDIQAHNGALLKALDLGDSKELTTIYCDVFFSISAATTGAPGAPLETEFDPSAPLRLPIGEWRSFSSLDEQLRELIGIGVMKDSVESMVVQYIASAEDYESRCAKTAAHIKTIGEIKQRLSSMELPARDEPIRNALLGLKRSHMLIRSRAEARLRKALARDDVAPALRTEAMKMLAEVDEVRANTVPEPAYTPRIAHDALLDYLAVTLERVKELETKVHSKSFHSGTLRELLLRCDQLARSVRLIESEPTARKVLRSKQIGELLRSFEALQLSIPLHRAFETGLDITVLGDAGAGKTTNLQVYAKHASSHEDSKTLILFVTLPTLIRYVEPAYACVPRLEGAIARYLAELGCPISEAGLIEALKEVHTVALLDSIDEAIPSCPRIIEAIKQLRGRYARLQIITTSRLSGTFAESTPFLQLRLLPFTPEQRSTFIGNWFGDKVQDARDVQNHLEKNPELAEVVRNPLAATILCVLQTHRVDLPVTEANLYKHRFDLLTGLFDRFKGVTRLRCRSEVLATVAKSLAYELHRRQRREAHEDEMRAWLHDALGAVMNVAELDLALKQLIHPCDVLILNSTGRLDFGHLRFQEYLVARELAENREIEIEHILGDPWWHDTFVLYAQMSKDMTWILNRASTQGILSCARRTLQAMFNTRREPERSALLVKLAALATMERPAGALPFSDVEEEYAAALQARDSHDENMAMIEQIRADIRLLDKEVKELDRSLEEKREKIDAWLEMLDQGGGAPDLRSNLDVELNDVKRLEILLERQADKRGYLERRLRNFSESENPA